MIKRQEDKSSVLVQTLALEALALAECRDVLSDVFVFLCRYSFLFENTQTIHKSCTNEDSYLYTLQQISDNPVKYTDPDGKFSEDLQTAFDNHMNETYVTGKNDCDIWLENRINEAYPQNTLSNDWGAAQTTNAIGHRNNLSNSLTDTMTDVGEYIVIQQSSGASNPNHVMAACLNEDGSVDVTHMTNNPSSGINPDTNAGYPETLHYDSQEDFINDDWGTLQFYKLSESLTEDN